MIRALLKFVVMPIHEYLAVNNRVGEGILIVEGWMSAQALAESAKVFNSGRYRYLVLVGGSILRGDRKSDHPTAYDDWAAERLENLGFDTEKLVKIGVPAVPVGERTIARAAAVKCWLTSTEISVCCVDVFTFGMHARKSWVLFRHVLGERYRVGVVAASKISYGRRFRFFSPRGIWLVVRNIAGFVYAKFWTIFDGKVRTLVALRSHSAPRCGFQKF